MECNKDEAIRAMDIAERKVTENDFIEAKKFATKAQNLFPQIDGLKQLLMVIDVNISAANNITGGEADWYGILGVDPLADDVALKKQYRKLALMLHPDKNKCKGAEGAFKLVLEAWNLLSDQAKRFAYNQKRMMTNKVQQTKSRKKPPPKAASNGAQNGKDSGPTSGRKRKGKQTKNDTKPPPQPASNEAQNARENAASSGRKSEKGRKTKSGMKPPPEPASNGTKPPPEPASNGMKPPPEPASNGTKPPPEPASNGTKPPPEPASNGTKPPPELASNGTKPQPEPASNGTKPPPEPASSGMKPPHQPASNGRKPPHRPASNDPQNVKDSSTASRGRTRSKSAAAPVDSSSTNRKVKNSGTFWTMCNGCRTKHHYVKAFYLNKALTCPNCHQTFIATELTPQPSVVKPNAVNQTPKEVKRGLEESQAKDAATKVKERIVKKRRTGDSYVAASKQGMT